MQNYEEFYAALQPMEKALKDQSAAALRLQKAVARNTETGNLAEASKALQALNEAVAELQATAKALGEHLDSLDPQTYFADGDFTRQLLEACEKRHIDVRGEKGVYEMFPFRVRVLGDPEHPAEVWINRRKLPSVRPSYVAETIAQSQARLYAARFNAQAFMNELAEAYETTCLKSNARIGSTQTLNKVYRALVPMARARKDYDAQAFAFDLARLYEAGTEAWIGKNGVRYTFGTSRDGMTGIRVLSKSGVESYINTIRSLNEE